jgi:hypothetical protein
MRESGKGRNEFLRQSLKKLGKSLNQYKGVQTFLIQKPLNKGLYNNWVRVEKQPFSGRLMEGF